jgi:hypothetical protein
MSRKKWSILLAASAVAVLVLAVLAEPALADPNSPVNPDKTGDNLGDLIRGIFKPLVLTVAGAVATTALFKRDWPLVFLLVGITIVILGFFVEPSPYQSWGDDILQTVFGASIGIR